MFLFGPPDVWKLKSKNNIKGLVKALNYYNNNKINEEAQKALIEIGPHAIEPLLISYAAHFTNYRCRETILKFGVKAIEPLVEIIQKYDNEIIKNSNNQYDTGYSRYHHTIFTALGLLGEFKNELAVYALTKFLENKNPDIRKQAASELGNIGNNYPVEPLIRLLKDTDHNIRQSAIIALGSIGDKRATDSLITLYKDNQGYGQTYEHECIAEALCKIGDERAFEVILDSIEYSRNSTFILTIVKAFGKFYNNQLVKLLIKFLGGYKDSCFKGDESFYFKGEVYNKLTNIGPQAVDLLISSLEESNQSLVEQIRHILENYKSKGIECEKITKALEFTSGKTIANKTMSKTKCRHSWVMGPDVVCHICGKKDEAGLPLHCTSCSLLVCHNCLDDFE